MEQVKYEGLKQLSELDPRFKDERGRVSQDLYMEYLSSLSIEEPEFNATPLDRLVASFMAARIEEARVALELHQMPDGRPWNEQGWWQQECWSSFAAGESKGLHKEE